jgi:hypothetical protein
MADKDYSEIFKLIDEFDELVEKIRKQVPYLASSQILDYARKIFGSHLATTLIQLNEAAEADRDKADAIFRERLAKVRRGEDGYEVLDNG